MLRRGLRYVDELSDAFKTQLGLVYRAKDLIGFGLRQKLREGYSAKDFRADLLAALVIGCIALPLSMGLAIACGVAPQHGLYTAVIAGLICALLGGSRFLVTGPTAALVVISVPIVATYHVSGLLVSGMLAGVMLLLMGLGRLGKLVQLVPHPVTTGLMAGIAFVLVMWQLPDALGISVPYHESILDHVASLWDARASINPWEVGVAAVTIALLVALPRFLKKVPAIPVVILLVTLAVVLLDRLLPGFHAATVGSRFSSTIADETVRGIPPLPPLPIVPWHAGGAPATLDFHMLRELLPSAFAIAMLCAIESMRTAVVADGMTGTQHDPNSELIALGIGNIVAPLFGGIPATGALARTATNIRAGARSPLSAAMQAIFVLACTILLAPLVAYIPMAALAGLIIVVARNLAEARHFVRLVRIAPRSDVTVMLACFGLTVVFDMVVAVTFGVMLAALLFMKRMAVLTQSKLAHVEMTKFEVPPGVRVYEIAGPLFFGAAKTAMETVQITGRQDHTLILSMKQVPTIDATGLVALESVLDRLFRSKISVIFAGLVPDVAGILDRAGLKTVRGQLAYAPDVETAISMAIVHAARTGRDKPPSVSAAS